MNIILKDPIYPVCNDYTMIKNILFIDDNISDKEIFVNSAKSDTFPIIYNFHTDRNKLNTFLRANFTNIDRISFVFHGFTTNSHNVNKKFINLEYLYTQDDLNNFNNNVSTYSDNITFIKNLITDLNVKNVDYLGCNLLTFANWQTYFNIIKKDNTVIIGASDDDTGNIKYGGDWILENTMEDISNIYFTSVIDTYTQLLLTFTYQYNSKDVTFYTAAETSPYNATVYDIDTSISGILDLTVLPVYNGNTYTITAIGNNALENVIGLTSIIMPNTVETIGNYGIANNNITSITLSNTLISIGDYAFTGNSSLTSLTLPDSLTTIGEGAFMFIAVSSLTIPNNVTVFANSLFEGASITNITFPTNLISIGNSVFAATTNLTNITMPNTVTSIGNNLIYVSKVTNITLSTGLTTIPINCFVDGTFLETIIIPNSIESIGTNAFKNCNALTNITIPNNIISIGTNAFQYTDITNIILPTTLTTIGSFAFDSANITKLVIPGTITTIDYGVFSNCSLLETVRILDGVQNINGGAFYNCASLVEITIPQSVTFIGYDETNAFTDCGNLTDIRIYKNNLLYKYIGTFSSTDRTDIINTFVSSPTIDTDLWSLFGFTNTYNAKSIEFQILTTSPYTSSLLFAPTDISGGLDLTIYPIYDGNNYPIVSIAHIAFYNSNLMSITIPNSVSTIGTDSFNNCGSLDDINIYKSINLYNYIGTFSTDDKTSIINTFVTSPTVDLALWLLYSDICFVENTLIETDQELIEISKINPNIHTIDNKKILYVTKTLSEDKSLILIKKNALGDNIPSSDIIMSKNHKILYDNTLVCAYYLADINDNIVEIEYNNEILYNILMEKYDTINIYNLTVETLHPKNKVALLYINKNKPINKLRNNFRNNFRK